MNGVALMMVWNMEVQGFEPYRPWMQFCPDYFFTTDQRRIARFLVRHP